MNIKNLFMPLLTMVFAASCSNDILEAGDESLNQENDIVSCSIEPLIPLIPSGVTRSTFAGTITDEDFKTNFQAGDVVAYVKSNEYLNNDSYQKYKFTETYDKLSIKLDTKYNKRTKICAYYPGNIRVEDGFVPFDFSNYVQNVSDNPNISQFDIMYAATSITKDNTYPTLKFNRKYSLLRFVINNIPSNMKWDNFTLVCNTTTEGEEIKPFCQKGFFSMSDGIVEAEEDDYTNEVKTRFADSFKSDNENSICVYVPVLPIDLDEPVTCQARLHSSDGRDYTTEITLESLDPGKYMNYEISINNQESLTYKTVDLGLSVLWADRNVGAASEEQSGIFVAWGETKEKASYIESTWAAKKGYSGLVETKDIDKTNAAGKNGSKYNFYLKSSCDAATVNMGNSWRMPTKEEFSELYCQCHWEYGELNGQPGYYVYKTDNAAHKGAWKRNDIPKGTYGQGVSHIFLPISGCIVGNALSHPEYGYYWSSTSKQYDNGYVEIYHLSLSEQDISVFQYTWDYLYGYCGANIRGVCAKQN